MNNYNHDSYCGVYCGACSVLMAYKTDRKDKFASFWTESTIKGFLQAQGVTVTESDSTQLKCHGCKTDTLFINCKPCKIRKCAIERDMEHCTDCHDYPCKLFHETLLNKNTLQQLPHLKMIPVNLTAIKNAGASQWLIEQAKKWKCPECQTEFSWYATNCATCGKDLNNLKDYNQAELPW